MLNRNILIPELDQAKCLTTHRYVHGTYVYHLSSNNCIWTDGNIFLFHSNKGSAPCKSLCVGEFFASATPEEQAGLLELLPKISERYGVSVFRRY